MFSNTTVRVIPVQRNQHAEPQKLVTPVHGPLGMDLRALVAAGIQAIEALPSFGSTVAILSDLICFLSEAKPL